VLANHGQRIGAGVAMLVSLDGKVTASTLGTPAQPVPFPYAELLKQAQTDGAAAGVRRFQGHAYQLVVVPVYAPLRIAWVAMGFPLDEAFARSLKQITGLDVSVVARTDDAKTPWLVSTLPDTLRPAFLGKSRLDGRLHSIDTLKLNGADYLTLRVPLARDDQVQAFLQTPLSEALAPYRQIQLRFGALALATLALFILGTILLARNVTRPVRGLVKAAERLARGDYSEPAPARADEFGQLAEAFNRMQAAIGERESRIIYQANHDGLTGLPNRNLARERIDAAIAECGTDGKVALLLMDVDRFKEINDTLGHDIGDEVLKTVSRRLEHSVRSNDTVARLGGDEFMVMLLDADEARASAMGHSLARHIAAPMRLRDVTVYLETSVGLVLYPDHGDDVETLLRRADIAMYDAKQARAGAMLYRAGRDERHLEQLGLMRDFRRAVAQGELRVHYQPKASLADGRVVQAEALVRWQHPERGLIYPDEFVPLAEQSGNVRWLTEWMLATVIAQLRTWEDAGIDLSVSVNLSVLDLMDSGLAERLDRVLHEQHVPPGRLMLEITESAMMRDAPAALALMHRLKAMGICFSIDDFGAGYSSLSRLRRLPVDEIKIDKSFVMNLRADSEDAVIVRSAVELGHNMGLRVIAEGVETHESLAVLRHYQCDMAQGYLISRPLPADDFEAWIAAHHARIDSSL
jgi:diguanylate cyclase (GGDEF)-like protein